MSLTVNEFSSHPPPTEAATSAEPATSHPPSRCLARCGGAGGRPRYRYLPRGVLYLTPLGLVADPRQTDWRDALPRLHRGHPERDLEPLVEHLAPGRRVLLVTPAPRTLRGHSPWLGSVTARTREWRAAIRRSPRLRPLGKPLHPHTANLRSAVRGELYRVSWPPPSIRTHPPLGG